MSETSEVVERTDSLQQQSEPKTDFMSGTTQWVTLKINWSPAVLIAIILVLEIILIGSIIYGLTPPTLK